MTSHQHFPKEFRRAVVERVNRSNGYGWCAYEDIEDFFSEIVDLENLPSADGRYENAAVDLHAHTVWNEDYEFESLLRDARFDPLLMTDPQFKKFVETGLRNDFQRRLLPLNEAGRLHDSSFEGDEARPIADLIRPMFKSMGFDIVHRTEFGVGVGYQVVPAKVNASNQGRAHSANPAPLQYKGLQFRSKCEIDFFKDIYSAGFLVAPLPVFVHKPTRRRVEPDFVIVKFGIWAIIELDGKAWHNESPADASRRLEPFTDENVRIIRFTDGELASSEGRGRAVSEILRKFENWRMSR